MPERRLRPAFYARPAPELAPLLLGKVLVRADGRAARIVEVEAYRGGDDPASHAHRGRTPRNSAMWGPPGRLYVYFTYGMHWCANVVAEDDGRPGAVLVRAAVPLRGLERMREARRGPGGVPPDRDLCRGPARLCRAFGIDGTLDGAPLTGPTATVWLAGDPTEPAPAVAVSPRIGIRVGTEHLWRFEIPGEPHVSARRGTLVPARRPAGAPTRAKGPL